MSDARLAVELAPRDLRRLGPPVMDRVIDAIGCVDQVSPQLVFRARVTARVGAPVGGRAVLA